MSSSVLRDVFGDGAMPDASWQQSMLRIKVRAASSPATALRSSLSLS